MLACNPATAKQQERIFEFLMKRVMKDAKAFFEAIGKESTKEVEAQVRTYLKTQKAGAFQALRSPDLKVLHNGWRNMMSLHRKRSEVCSKKATFGKKIVFTNLFSLRTLQYGHSPTVFFRVVTLPGGHDPAYGSTPVTTRTDQRAFSISPIHYLSVDMISGPLNFRCR
jgi:hypothetical protein